MAKLVAAVAIEKGFYQGHQIEIGQQVQFNLDKDGGVGRKLPSWLVEATPENLAKVGDVLPQNHGMVEIVEPKKKGGTRTYRVATPEPTVAPNSGDRLPGLSPLFPEKAEERAAEEQKEATKVRRAERAAAQVSAQAVKQHNKALEEQEKGREEAIDRRQKAVEEEQREQEKAQERQAKARR